VKHRYIVKKPARIGANPLRVGAVLEQSRNALIDRLLESGAIEALDAEAEPAPKKRASKRRGRSKRRDVRAEA